MFYEHNQVDDLLNCPGCGERFDSPYLLPCYRTICKRCIQRGTDQHGELSCPFCVDVAHQVPENGFAVNDTINSLLKLKPVDVHRAEMYRRIADLLKNIQSNLIHLENLEANLKTNFFDYFDLIKKEISSSADNVINHTIKYRDKLISDVDLVKKQSSEYFMDLIEGSLVTLRKSCFDKKEEWEDIIEMRSNDKPSNDSKMNLIINEASHMNSHLNKTRNFIENTITSRKLIFNQAEPFYIQNESALIGQLEFNDDSFEMIDHKLKINFLNDLVKLNESTIQPGLTRQADFLVPIICQKILSVSKTSYDEFSNYSLTISDLDQNNLASNDDILDAKINAVSSYGDYILIGLTDNKTSRNIIKLYNSSLNLKTTTFIENPCDSFFLNDQYIYAKTTATHPYIFKFDYDLTRKALFENVNKSNELFVSFVVDKLIYISSNTNRIYFNDKCFSRLKIFSEVSGELLSSIHVNNLRDCSIRIDTSLNNSMNDQFICLNRMENCLRCYDIKKFELGAGPPELVAENFLSDKIKNITKFFLTKDGYYIFVDQLNDIIFYY